MSNNLDGVTVRLTVNDVFYDYDRSELVGVAIDAGGGNDRVELADDVSAAATIGGSDGDDTLIGGAGADLIDGEAGNDSIVGRAGGDTLSGSDGSDTIDGGAGADVLDGGFDNDSLLGGDDADTLTGGLGNDTLVGGDGPDSIEGSLGASFFIVGDVGPGVDDDSILGGAGNDTISGGEGADSIAGEAGDDSIDGGPGDDTISGGDDQDTLAGGEGVDSVDGGLGYDVLQFFGTDDADTINAVQDITGAVVVTAASDMDTGSNVEGVEIWALGGDDVVTVDGSDNLDSSLNGGDGNDTLTGGAGNDLLAGGPGSDSLDGRGGEDVLRFLGTDLDDTITGTIYASGTVSLSRLTDTVTALGIEKIYVAAFDGADSIVLTYEPGAAAIPAWIDSGSGNDTIVSGPGADFLYGGFGDDSIDGGGGDDTILGAEDNDTILAGDGNDSVSGGWGSDVIDGGAGNDTLLGWDDDDTLLGGEGDDLLDGGPGNDYIDSGGGTNTLIGGMGNDTMVGGTGNDTFILQPGSDDVVSDPAGVDTFDFSLAGRGVTVDLSQAAGEQQTVDVMGNTLTITGTIENARGSRFADHITGNDESNRLAGGDGDDTLEGGEGNDLLDGGNGHDHLIGGSRSHGGGRRRGCDDDTLDGGADDDSLDGGRGSDVLQSGGGDNEVTADLRRDIILPSSGSNRIIHVRKTDPPCRTDGPRRPAKQSGGNDAGRFFRIENGTLSVATGDGPDSIKLEDRDGDLIITINGAEYPFPLDGLAAIRVQAGGGNDLVQLGNVSIPVEVFGGPGNDTLAGNSGDNTLHGGRGNDWIIGWSGDDVLDGGPGNDVLVGGAGQDRITGGPGRDLIRGGAGDDWLNGGEGRDVIDAGSGNDVIEHMGRRDLRLPAAQQIEMDFDQLLAQVAAELRAAGLRVPRAWRGAGKLSAFGTPPPTAIAPNGSNTADVRIAGAAPTPSAGTPGAALTYRFRLVNDGPRNASMVTFYDEVSRDFSFDSANPSQGSCTGWGTLVCDLGDMPRESDQGVSITLPGVVGDDPGSSIANTPTVTSGGPTDPNTTNNTTNIVTAVPQAKLKLVKTDSPDPVLPNQNLTYGLAVTNSGPDATSYVEVRDYLPGGVVYVSGDFGCAPETSDVIRCVFQPIDPGVTRTMYLTVHVSATTTGTLSNAACITSSGAFDRDLSDDCASAVTKVDTSPNIDLSITKTDSPDPVVRRDGVWDLITYTLTATATGTPGSVATNVQIKDTLQKGLTLQSATFVTSTGQQGTCSGSKAVTCSVGSLVPDATATATIVVQPTKAGPIGNCATVSSNFKETNKDNNKDCEATKAVAVDLVIYNSSTQPAEDRPKEKYKGTKAGSAGAFAVANINDTNANGKPDVQDEPVLATDAQAGRFGRNEVDLMALDVKRPKDYTGDPVTVTVTSGDNAALWGSSWKQDSLGQSTAIVFGASEMTRTLWVEARKVSKTVGDIKIEAAYGQAITKVQATGVWAELTAMAHDRLKAADLLKKPEWADMNEKALSFLKVYVQGVGLVPKNASFMGNSIAIQYTVQPAGTWQFAYVSFDAARQMNSKEWVYVGAQAVVDGREEKFPKTEEWDNDDDKTSLDESIEVTKPIPGNSSSGDHFYSLDAPGYAVKLTNANVTRMIQRLNMREFIRVRFDGTRPKAFAPSTNEGNANAASGVEGSRCSAYDPWHSRVRIVKQGTKWVRDPDDDLNENDHNKIEPGDGPVGDAP